MTWSRELTQSGGDLRAVSVAIDPETSAVAAIVSGDPAPADGLRYFDRDGDLRWARLGTGQVWFDRDGGVNGLRERYDSMGESLDSFRVDSLSPLAVDTDDNIFAGGLEKRDPNRELLWSHELATPFGTKIDMGLALDEDGNAYVHWTGLSSQLCAISDHLRKYDPDGVELWTVCLRESDDDAPAFGPIAVDANGDVLLVKARSEAMGSKDAPVPMQLSLQRLNPEGRERWTRRLGEQFAPRRSFEIGSRVRLLSALAVDAMGNLILAGSVLGREPDVSDDIWIAKYDGEANPIWSTVIEAEAGQDDEAVSLAVDPSGAVVVVGTLDVGAVHGPSRVWLARLAP